MKLMIATLSFLTIFGLSGHLNNGFDYEKAWKEVDELRSKGLPKSALEKTEEIYQAALKEKNNPQLIKAVVYQCRFRTETDEKGIETSIDRLNEQIQSQQGPAKYILQSYLAELYLSYFEANRYLISQRTNLNSAAGPDFRTWTTQNFLQTISSLYLASLKDKEMLQDETTKYSTILYDYDDDALQLRPTLFELLADKALKFFITHTGWESQNPESFTLDSPLYLEDASEFAKLDIADIYRKQSSSSAVDLKNSPEYNVLILFQNILSIQINAQRKKALLDYDLQRLEYVLHKARLENKNELYIRSLSKLTEMYEKEPEFALILAGLAGAYKNNTADSLANVKALDICQKAVKIYPESRGALLCKQIIADIKAPVLDIFAENVYSSEKSMLFALDYNNLKNIRLALIPWDKANAKTWKNKDQAEILNFLKNQKAVYTANYTLSPSALFQKQRMEVTLPKHNFGDYALLAEAKDENGTPVFQYVLFTVSDLAYTSWIENEKRVFLITDRKNGQPLSGVKAEFYRSGYNPSTRSYESTLLSRYTTRKDGKIVLDNNSQNAVKVVLTKGKDRFDPENFHSMYSYGKSRGYHFAEIFTDRSIYRPGQIVYFKALLLHQNENNIPSLLSGKSVEVHLKDANYQIVNTLNLKSNDYGSVHGSFVIPPGKLTGSYSLEISSADGISGFRPFQVEEYKRPTFEVTTEPVTETFVLNDWVTIKGKAATLAGSNVDGAQVTYKVVRNVRFPWWRWWWRMPAPGNDYIITTGSTETDADGKFELRFQAIPDRSVAQKDNPVFYYNVEVNVTDQRGETRSTTALISVGYAPFVLKSNLPSEIDQSRLKSLSISAYNTNNEKIKATGTYTMYRLKSPAQVKISKYWDGKVDIPIPLDVLQKELSHYPTPKDQDYSQWEIEKTILSGNFDTDHTIAAGNKMDAGVYRLDMKSKDQNGKEIAATDYVVITDFNKKSFPNTAFLYTEVVKNTLQPGETFVLRMGTSSGPVYANVIVEKDGNALFSSVMKVSGYAQVQLPVKEHMRGGFSVKVSYIQKNRKYENQFSVDVPWTNKTLDIAFETFRDKAMPGSDESYSLRITGMNREKVTAEVLAAMYDASLDQFTGHFWRTGLYPSSFSRIYLEIPGFNMVQGRYFDYGNKTNVEIKQVKVPALITMFEWGFGGMMYEWAVGGMRSKGEVMMQKSGMPAPAAEAMDTAVNPIEAQADSSTATTQPDKKPESVTNPPRQNLKETVFFFPDLKTDADGNVKLTFRHNEALTRWRLMTMAHTKDLKIGYAERMVQTTKNLMVFPNAPRFLRDGDNLSFSAKVTNLTDSELTGTASIRLWDALTMKDITGEIVKSAVTVSFKADKGRSAGISWDLDIPEAKYQAITWNVSATAGNHTDAEENSLPVITNRILVTESIPFWVKGKADTTLVFTAFKDNLSPTKKDFRLTLEYTAHPVWYAVQALPYIEQSGNAGTQTLVNRLFTNMLASRIANSYPRIKAVFDQWRQTDKEALISSLMKNEEFKNAILEETPWVRQALSESEQKRNIALLFDLNTLANQKHAIIAQLRERQLSNGGFPWFEGGRDNLYTTQNVLETIAQLNHLGALYLNDPALTDIISLGLKYMDERTAERYQQLMENIRKYGGNKDLDHLDEASIHYLYVRSFFKNYKTDPKATEAGKYYFGQAKKYWLQKNLYCQALIGLTLHRANDGEVRNILRSLREKSFSHPERGMYWNAGNGMYWYELPIERQATLIQLFSEAGGTKEEVDKMKLWLLMHKQTHQWKTSKATASVIYALLMQGEKEGMTAWIQETAQPVIQIAGKPLAQDNSGVQAGTGYFKNSWAGPNLDKNLSDVRIKNDNSSIGWGGLYYQYLEVLDKVKGFEDTPLKINKKWYKVTTTNTGEKLTEIAPETVLKPGDKLKVRIEIRVDRNMEYIHMKDMRPSGVEPANVLSGYRYQGGLGYYESTRDLASHFYFDYLPKGTYVFEYPLTVVHKGNFTGGITTIQSMYAPEFSSHSQGARLSVK